MLLEQLSNARGVSGDESAVRAIIAEQVSKTADEYRVDALGNLIACKRASVHTGRHTPLKVLVAAHMDEVGFIITHLDRDGMAHFDKVGGIDDRILPGKRVLVGKQGVPGVIGFKPRYRTTKSERKRVVAHRDLYIDLGANSREEAERVVSPGDYATFATQYAPIGDNCVRGKALDDRAGCALLVELLRGSYPFDLYAVFTTQEELGLRGARAAGYAVAPALALVLEATVCDDSPKACEQSPVTRLGAGPALTLADRGLFADKRLVKLCAQTAQENKLPFQFKEPLIGGTDGGQLHRVREGVPTAVISLPARYIHSPAAVISLDDYNHALKLLRATLPRLGKGLPNHDS